MSIRTSPIASIVILLASTAGPTTMTQAQDLEPASSAPAIGFDGATAAPYVGFVSLALPASASPITYNGSDYFYNNGAWYASWGGRYLVVKPPYGISAPNLPADARSVPTAAAGSMYYVNGFYYRQSADQGYVVVRKPRDA